MSRLTFIVMSIFFVFGFLMGNQDNRHDKELNRLIMENRELIQSLETLRGYCGFSDSSLER